MHKFPTNLFAEDATYVTAADKINAEFNSADVYNEAAQKYVGIDTGTFGTPNGFTQAMDAEDQETLPVVDIANMKAGVVKTHDSARCGRAGPC